MGPNPLTKPNHNIEAPSICRTRDGTGRYLVISLQRNLDWDLVTETWRLSPPPARAPREWEQPSTESLEYDHAQTENLSDLGIRVALARVVTAMDSDRISLRGARTIFKPYQ